MLQVSLLPAQGGAQVPSTPGQTPDGAGLLPHLSCPICCEPFNDPVVLSSSGITYCRTCIEQWLCRGNSTCPMTNQHASCADIKPNYALRDMLQHAHGQQQGQGQGMDRLTLPSHARHQEHPNNRPPPESGARAVPGVDPGVDLVNRASDAQDIQSLVALLNSAAPATHCAALQAIRILIADNPTARKQAIDSGAIPVLARLLSSATAGTQEQAARAIRDICIGSSASRLQVAAYKGIIPSLVALLNSPAPATHEAAAKAIGTLCCDNLSAKNQAAESGALPALAALISSAAPSTQKVAALAIGNVCQGSTKTMDHLVASGAIPSLVALLKSAAPHIQEAVAKVVRGLFPRTGKRCMQLFHLTSERCSTGRALQQAVENGAIPALVKLLGAAAPSTQEAAAGAIWNMCWHRASIPGICGTDHLVGDSGVLPALMPLLSSATPSVQDAAAGAFGEICPYCAVNAVGHQIPDWPQLIDGGAIPALVKLFSSATPATQAAAASAVGSICTQNFGPYEASAMKQVAASGVVPALVRLLSSASPATQETAARAIHSMYGNYRISSRHLENAAMDSNAIPALMPLLGTAARDAAAHAIEKLCRRIGPAGSQQALDSGAIPALVLMLSSSSSATQEAAVQAIGTICNKSPSARQQVVDGGAANIIRGMRRDRGLGVYAKAAWKQIKH